MNTSLQSLAMEDSDSDPTADSPSPEKQQPHPAKQPPPSPPTRDFLLHLEAYLAKRDGVDKLLKISRYASKLILATSSTSPDLTRRLKSFESSVGLSRKAFRLGKFIQDLNALRTLARHPHRHHHDRLLLLLSIIAYGGEGLYFFVEQFVWLAKSGLIEPSHARRLGKVSAWAELVGYVGSVALKILDLRELVRELKCLESTVEIKVVRGETVGIEEREKEEKVKRKMMMKKMSVVQDLADAVMAMADVREANGSLLSSPLVLSGAGLLSALISTHKNWVSC